MKRTHMITKLTEIGYNPTRLADKSNEELRQAMAREAVSLERYATNKAILAQQHEEARQKSMKRTRERLAYEDQQRAAEIHRQRVMSRPLPPIITVGRNSALILDMIEKCKAEYARFSALFRQSADPAHAKRANDAMTTETTLRKELAAQ